MCGLFQEIKITQIYMNQNKENLFKANCHVIIQWLTQMKRNFGEKKLTISQS